VLSIALVAWARSTADVVRIPAVVSPVLGLALTLSGFTLLLRGVGQLFPHPFYTGFCIICAGVSIAVGSASGLWLVSPVVALSCTALVLGYERRERPGPASARLLPRAGTAPPTGSDRLRFYLFVLLPWLVLYEAVLAIGLPPDATSGVSRFEEHLPVIEWSQIFYASTYFLTIFAPVFAKTRSDLRRYAVCGLWAMLLAYPAFLIIPLIAPKRPFTPHTVPGHLLVWERTLDSPVAAFPSFHVIWAMLAAEVFARRWPKVKWLFYGWAILVAASCVTTSQHSLLDVLGGAATVALITRGPQLWGAVRRHAERIANSWHEWRIGPVRVVNHGFYAGAGGFLAVWLAETMAGPGMQASVLVAATAAIIGAGLWAQFADGSSRLPRPVGVFGEFVGGLMFGLPGGLSGGTAGAFMAPLFGTGAWLILAALAMAAPLAQAAGSLRCLVLGCCHGRPTGDAIGIQYVHPRSRVCQLSEWTGVPLHPTPVYSILCNVAIALILTRLWMLAAPLHLIAGLYFILAGAGKFVEEGWRGDPRTPVFLRLRVRQWAAITSVIGGALMTALGRSSPAPQPHFAANTLLAALVFGLAVALATGVDFPNPATLDKLP